VINRGILSRKTINLLPTCSWIFNGRQDRIMTMISLTSSNKFRRWPKEIFGVFHTHFVQKRAENLLERLLIERGNFTDDERIPMVRKELQDIKTTLNKK